MDCTQIRGRLLAWQYGELSPAEQAEVARHLAACAVCRQEASGWQEFRGQLQAFTGPAVQVNIPGIYQQALQRRESGTRRWRRAAVAVTALAAAVLIAVVPKLEVRVDASQLIVRWGAPAEPVPAPVLAQTPAPAPQVSAEDLALVKNLVRALAQEVQAGDRRQQEALLAMQARLEYVLGQTSEYVAANERDKAVLAAQFRLQRKGDHQ